MIDNGIDPVSSEGSNFPLTNVEEVVGSVDPFKARFTATAGGEMLTMAIEENLPVVAP